MTGVQFLAGERKDLIFDIASRLALGHTVGYYTMIKAAEALS
jgi:hypothetical protein